LVIEGRKKKKKKNDPEPVPNLNQKKEKKPGRERGFPHRPIKIWSRGEGGRKEALAPALSGRKKPLILNQYVGPRSPERKKEEHRQSKKNKERKDVTLEARRKCQMTKKLQLLGV